MLCLWALAKKRTCHAHLHPILLTWQEEKALILKMHCVINLTLNSPSHAFVLRRTTCFHPSVGYRDGNSNRCGTNTRNIPNSRRYATPGGARLRVGGTLSSSRAAHLICQPTFWASLHVLWGLTHICSWIYSVCVWQLQMGLEKKMRRGRYVNKLPCMCVCDKSLFSCVGLVVKNYFQILL